MPKSNIHGQKLAPYSSLNKNLIFHIVIVSRISSRVRWVLAVLGSADKTKILDAFDSSIITKIDDISCGLWDQNIPILILVDNLEELDNFEKNPYLRRHSNIRVLSFEKISQGNIIQQAKYNVWRKSWEFSFINILKPTETIPSENSFNFQDYKAYFNLVFQHYTN